jgi:hypothetical protein
LDRFDRVTNVDFAESERGLRLAGFLLAEVTMTASSSWKWILVACVSCACSVDTTSQAVSLGTDVPPPHVIMDFDDGIWAGGLTRLPDGSYYVVYERKSPNAQVFGRKTSDLVNGPFGAEEHIAGKYGVVDYFDPGVVVEKSDGTLMISAGNGRGVYLFERSPNGAIAGPTTILDGTHAETTFRAFRGDLFLTTNGDVHGDGDCSMNVDFTRVYGPTSHGPVLDVSGDVHVTYGPSGDEKRNTTSETGGSDELITVWSHSSPSACPNGDRGIWASISTNNGASWGAPHEIGGMESADLTNPYVVAVPGGHELRVYAIARGAPGKGNLVVARSTNDDHGRHWSAFESVPLPQGIASVSRPVVAQVGAALVMFAAWSDEKGHGHLGTFTLP